MEARSISPVIEVKNQLIDELVTSYVDEETAIQVSRCALRDVVEINCR